MSHDQNLASDLIGQRNQRIEKINQMKKLGLDPYPTKSQKSNSNHEIKEKFAEFEGKEVTIAGRVMTWREHGELQFANIQDATDTIQLYIFSKELLPTSSETQNIGAEDIGLIDIGDHIEATGIVTKTQRGEISIKPTSLKMLSKAIRPLPNKWGGIQDNETRFRRRYLDMTMNTEVRKRFERRAKFWDATRQFLKDNGFYEVNNPILEHTTGGADAKPFETHMDAINEDFYLRISQELPLKRLLGAGFEKVFDIGTRFRNEGFSDEHLPEHIAMEWYWAYADWRDGMAFTEALFKYVLKETFGTLQFKIGNFEIDVDKKWDQHDYTTLLRDQFGVDIFNDSLEDIRDILLQHNPSAEISMNRSRLVDSLWKVLRKDMTGPAFLIGVPTFFSPLAKTDPENPLITQRFQPILLGSEMANAFTELNDPQDQLDRFVEQQSMREGGDDEAHMMDIDFVEMLEYGMPPAVGFGFTERVFWAFEGVTAREGVPFPPMRRGYENTTKKIYGDVYDFEAEERGRKAKSLSRLKIQDGSPVNLNDVSENVETYVEETLFETNLQFRFGLMKIEGVKVEKSNADLLALISYISNQVDSQFNTSDDVKGDPHISGLRAIYEQFGMNPNKFVSNTEDLLKRVAKGKGLYNVNNIVDICNATSIESKLSVTAFDADKIDGGIFLCKAVEGDEVVLMGEEASTEAIEGTLVFSDKSGVISWNLNCKHADRTKLGAETKDILIRVDTHSKVSEAELKSMMELLAGRVIHFCGGKVAAWSITNCEK